MLTLMLALSACATSSGYLPQETRQKSSVKSSISLEKMDAQFLYLASQQARASGQQALAARFLKALVQRKPAEIEPKLELVELYLELSSLEYSKQAQHLLASISDESVKGLDRDVLGRYQLLYAQVSIANGEAQQALLHLRQILKADPKDIRVRLMLVRVHIVLREWMNAYALLDEGLKLEDDLRLSSALAQLYLQQNKVKEADKILAEIQRKHQDNEAVVVQRSQLAENQGDLLKAEALLKMYMDTHEGAAIESSVMLAELYVRQNQLDDAVLVYQQVIRMTGGVIGVQLSLGKVYYQLGKYQEAILSFEKAFEQLPELGAAHELTNQHATVLFYLGASMEAAHLWRQATPHYQRLEPKHTFYVDAQLRLANIEVTQHQYAAAEKRLLVLRKDHTDRLDVYEMLSGLRVQQKAYKKLLDESEQALDLGFSSILWFNRAVAFEALQKYEALDTVLESLLTQKPQHAEALNFYGYSLADRGVRLEDAEKMIEKALQIKPNDGYYLDSLAWVYFKKKRYTKAIEIQLVAVGMVGEDAVMQEHLGDMYWLSGQQEQARVHWQQAIVLKHSAVSVMKNKIKHGIQ